MDLTPLEKSIYKEIKNVRKIRWADLKRIIVDEKALISERVFRESLNEMVDMKIVHRREISRQNVEYYVDVNIVKLENQAKQFFEINFPELKRLINHIEKNQSKIPIVDLAGYIAILWQVASHFEYKGAILSYITNTDRLTKLKGWKEIKPKLLKLVISIKNIDERLELIDLSDAIIYQGTYQGITAIRKDLELKNIPWMQSKNNVKSDKHTKS